MTTEINLSEDYVLAFGALQRQLQIPIPSTTKAPAKFDVYLDTTSASQNGIEALLFSFSSQAWLAFHLAEESHRDLISRVQKLSQDERNLLAEQLKAVPADSSYGSLWDHLFGTSSRCAKRLKKLQQCAAEKPGGLETSAEPNATSPPSAETSRPIARREGRYEWPKSERLPTVFPTRLSRMLKKIDGLAAVFASFPSDPTRCTLEFDVISRMVPFTAKELFDVHLSYHDERCILILQDGVEIELLGSIVLRGASNVTSSGFIGPQLGMAYRNGQRYRDEQFLGEELTQCLAMAVEANVDSPGRLSLTMEAESLEEIVQSLWR